MIDKNEMRIGNYFIGEDKVLWLSQIRHAENVKEWSYKGWHEETKERIEVNFFDAEPIPLTTEILEKCGFEWYEPLKHWRLVDKEQWYSIREMKFDNLKEKSLCFSWTNLAWDEGQSMPYILVKTVHQLQNLFYALHQKELEIKL